MSMIAVLGLAAGFCTTVAFVPQVLKTWQTRHTKDISLVMFLILAAILLFIGARKTPQENQSSG